MIHGGMGFDHTGTKEAEKKINHERKGGTDIMKTYKAMFVAAMLGAMVMLPKVTWAGDISVGFFMGLPVPVVTFDAPRVHHAPPPVFVKPVPVYNRWHAYGPNYHVNKHDRHYKNSRFGHRNYGQWDHKRDGRWDRR